MNVFTNVQDSIGLSELDKKSDAEAPRNDEVGGTVQVFYYNEVDKLGELGSQLAKARLYTCENKAMKLIKELVVLANGLVDTPNRWDEFSRVSREDRDSNSITKHFYALKDEVFFMRRYSIAMITHASQLRYEYLVAQRSYSTKKKNSPVNKRISIFGSQPESDGELPVELVPVLKDLQVHAKTALQARSKARNALNETRAAISIAERLYAALLFMSKLLSALDLLAHNDEYCDNMSASFAQLHAAEMFDASLRITYLDNAEQTRMEFLDEVMTRPGDVSARDFKKYQKEHRELRARYQPNFVTTNATPTEQDQKDQEEAFEMAIRLRHLHNDWLTDYFENVAAQDRWEFHRELKNKLAQDCKDYASDFKLIYTPTSNKGRACIDSFWKYTLLGKQHDPTIWYETERQSINEMIDTDIIPIAQNMEAMLNERAQELLRWTPDLVRYAKPEFDV